MPKHHKPQTIGEGALASLEAAGQAPRKDRVLTDEQPVAEDYAASAAARHRPRPRREPKPFDLKKGKKS